MFCSLRCDRTCAEKIVSVQIYNRIQHIFSNGWWRQTTNLPIPVRRCCEILMGKPHMFQSSGRKPSRANANYAVDASMIHSNRGSTINPCIPNVNAPIIQENIDLIQNSIKFMFMLMFGFSLFNRLQLVTYVA